MGTQVTQATSTAIGAGGKRPARRSEANHVRVLKLPATRSEPVADGAGLVTIWKGRLLGWLCCLLNHLRVPGTVQETVIEDKLTGQTVRVSIGLFFTRISVNGRDYY